MDIYLNGKKQAFDPKSSLIDVLKALRIDPGAGYFAAAVNEKVVKRSEWPSFVLKAGDRVEVIQMVQGG